MRTIPTDQHTASLRLTALSLAVFAMFGATQAMAASDKSNAEMSAAMKFALQRDLGVMPGQIPGYLDTEKRAIRRQGEARDALGASFAGAWMERDASGDFKLVVATTDRNRSAKVSANGQEVRVMRRSLAQLETVMSQLNRGQAALGVRSARGGIDPSIHSWRIDLRSNSVVVTTDPGAQNKAVDFIAASGADVNAIRFDTSKTRPQPTFDIRGGDRYWTSVGGRCSIGFSVRQGDSTGFATAGHCGTVGTTVSGNNLVGIGSFVGAQWPGADHAWVRITNPGAWAIRPWVNAYDFGGNLDVVGNLETPVGGMTCRSGATTGARCGTITAKNVTVNYSAGLTFGLVQSNACLGNGDSGGSFVSPAGEAQGVTSGGAGAYNNAQNNCDDPSARSFYQPIQPLINAYGLVLETVQTCGRMNPGRTLTNGGSITSCDGRFTLVIQQSDGRLVLNKLGLGAIWNNGVFGSGHRLSMQPDGNLVVYNAAGQSVWNSGTSGNRGAFLSIQNDGNAVIYSHLGQALAATGTSGL
jgi:hypothetical protein